MARLPRAGRRLCARCSTAWRWSPRVPAPRPAGARQRSAAEASVACCVSNTDSRSEAGVCCVAGHARPPFHSSVYACTMPALLLRLTSTLLSPLHTCAARIEPRSDRDHRPSSETQITNFFARFAGTPTAVPLAAALPAFSASLAANSSSSFPSSRFSFGSQVSSSHV